MLKIIALLPKRLVKEPTLPALSGGCGQTAVPAQVGPRYLAADLGYDVERPYREA